MKFSVVIATKDRAELLDGALASLRTVEQVAAMRGNTVKEIYAA